MNGNQQMQVHYSSTGFPYNAAESFVDFFGGLPHVPVHYPHPPPMQHQESAFWPMNMNSYRIGVPVPESTSQYHPYEVNDELTRMDFHRRAWQYPSVMNIEETTTMAMPYEENTVANMQPIPEEMSTPTGTVSPQDDAESQDQGVRIVSFCPSTPKGKDKDGSMPFVNQNDITLVIVAWEDDIDPDNMTYEELVDLGETVGTESRGLSQEAIDLLPKSKFKSGGIFSRKRSSERCVICQTRYKRGDRQINLPCKHVYHADCGSKWLSINKTCPVCNCEVLIDDLKH